MKVWTIGSDSCWKEDGAEVDKKDSSIVITPYDLPNGKGSNNCFQILTSLSRNVEIKFNTPGEKMIQVKGRQVRDDSEEETMIEIEKTVGVE